MVMAYNPDQSQPQPQNPGDFLQPRTQAPTQNQPMYLPMGGENPMSSMPEYGGAGGSQQAADYYAAQKFKELFGRNPTASELAMVSGAYLSGDPNVAGLGQGNAAVAQYFQAMSNTPANLYARQQQQWSQDAPKQYDAVNKMFQDTYGRQASQDELSHYSTLLSSGQADPYQLSQFLQSLPEYQNAQDTKFRQGLDSQLQDSDQNFFNRVSPQISQKYAMMGRPTSPALSVAMTDLAAQLSENRGNYMAQLSASQYGGNKTAAMSNYGKTQDDVMGRINQNPMAQYNNIQGVNSRIQNLTDYDAQARNFGRMQDQYGNKGPGALDYLNTAFNGINAGAKAYAAA